MMEIGKGAGGCHRASFFEIRDGPCPDLSRGKPLSTQPALNALSGADPRSQVHGAQMTARPRMQDALTELEDAISDQIPRWSEPPKTATPMP
jgi:hypothetical protein